MITQTDGAWYAEQVEIKGEGQGGQVPSPRVAARRFG
jgi:hypothetical protein